MTRFMIAAAALCMLSASVSAADKLDWSAFDERPTADKLDWSAWDSPVATSAAQLDWSAWDNAATAVTCKCPAGECDCINCPETCNVSSPAKPQVQTVAKPVAKPATQTGYWAVQPVCTRRGCYQQYVWVNR